MAHPLRGTAAITGLGMTPMGRIYGKSSTDFAVEAVRLAIADAGLGKADVDGLLINAGVTGNLGGGVSLALQNALGMTDLRLLNHMNAAGSTAAQMVQYATMAINAGMARHVVCVFADAPLRENRSAGAAYGGAGRASVGPSGISGLFQAAGYFGANTGYALAARRHMALYGTTQDQLGAVAVAERAWATMNPAAQMREPITLQDYHASRWIVEPLHLLDCCLVSNGAVAVVVSGADEAPSMAQPPVYILGMGQGSSWRSPPRRLRPRDRDRRAYRCGDGLLDGRRRPGGRRRLRAVRLLHLHRARHARGLRLLQEGGGRRLRRGRQALGRAVRSLRIRVAASSRPTTCGA